MGLLSDLGGLATSAVKGLGDFIGLDGKFGMGAGIGNQSYSLAGLGDSFSSLFGDDLTKNQNLYGAEGIIGTGLANQAGTQANGLLGNMNLMDLAKLGLGGYSAMKQGDLIDTQVDAFKQQMAAANEDRAYDKAEQARLNDIYRSTSPSLAMG